MTRGELVTLLRQELGRQALVERAHFAVYHSYAVYDGPLVLDQLADAIMRGFVETGKGRSDEAQKAADADED